MTVFEGITQRVIDTPRLSIGVLERAGDAGTTPAERTVVFLHGLLTSSLLWQEIMQDLPSDLRVIAVDLRGCGESENLPVDATRGVQDYSDDLKAVLDELDVGAAHLVGWSLGGAVAMRFALDHPVRSLTLQAPISPFGFGGTRRDGTRLTNDDAGCGGGAVDQEFVRRLQDGDDGTDPTSPRILFRTHFVAEGYASEFEDVWVESMLATSTASGNYPGDSVDSEHWPGFAAGDDGVLNAIAPGHFDGSAIVQLAEKPPILWIHGDADVVISDTSMLDTNRLGALGAVPGWPGDDVAPAQPMVSQTRDVLAAYSAAGGDVTEVALDGVGHSPHLERPVEFRRALLTVIGYVGPSINPAPPTETIILRSAD